MITKGTNEYKAAQQMANNLADYANTNRQGGASIWDLSYEKVARFLLAVKDLGTFASEIAKTVESSMNCYGYQVARMSSKQAWILACAAVENKIEF